MKKTMVYVLALTLAFSTFLAGCGEMRGTDGRTTAPTATPQQTMIPETMMPNPEDGVVRDNDGIITDGDSGNGTGNTPNLPESTMRPGTGAGGTNSGNNTAGMPSSAKR